MAQAKHVTTAIPSQITDASRAPFPHNVKAAHADFVAALAGQAPRAIPLFPAPVDFEDRADQLDKVLTAVSVYLTAILQETEENVPGGLDLRCIEAGLSDIISDVVGTVRQAANDLAGRFA